MNAGKKEWAARRPRNKEKKNPTLAEMKKKGGFLRTHLRGGGGEEEGALLAGEKKKRMCEQ